MNSPAAFVTSMTSASRNMMDYQPEYTLDGCCCLRSSYADGGALLQLQGRTEYSNHVADMRALQRFQVHSSPYTGPRHPVNPRAHQVDSAFANRDPWTGGRLYHGQRRNLSRPLGPLVYGIPSSPIERMPCNMPAPNSHANAHQICPAFSSEEFVDAVGSDMEPEYREYAPPSEYQHHASSEDLCRDLSDCYFHASRNVLDPYESTRHVLLAVLGSSSVAGIQPEPEASGPLTHVSPQPQIVPTTPLTSSPLTYSVDSASEYNFVMRSSASTHEHTGPLRAQRKVTDASSITAVDNCPEPTTSVNSAEPTDPLSSEYEVIEGVPISPRMGPWVRVSPAISHASSSFSFTDCESEPE